jgi:hypothetical protein
MDKKDILEGLENILQQADEVVKETKGTKYFHSAALLRGEVDRLLAAIDEEYND